VVAVGTSEAARIVGHPADVEADHAPAAWDHIEVVAVHHTDAGLGAVPRASVVDEHARERHPRPGRVELDVERTAHR
jgi:hypothetical protein